MKMLVIDFYKIMFGLLCEIESEKAKICLFRSGCGIRQPPMRHSWPTDVAFISHKCPIYRGRKGASNRTKHAVIGHGKVSRKWNILNFNYLENAKNTRISSQIFLSAKNCPSFGLVLWLFFDKSTMSRFLVDRWQKNTFFIMTITLFQQMLWQSHTFFITLQTTTNNATIECLHIGMK